MDRIEASLLVYLETCATDTGGLIDPSRINGQERAIIKRWDAEGFITYNRVASKYTRGGRTPPTAVQLSEEAWTVAHKERRARFERINTARTWRTTKEIS